jgi:hypothetical protein
MQSSISLQQENFQSAEQTFSCLSVKKNMLWPYRYFIVRNPGILTIQRTFGTLDVPTLALHMIKADSVRNYHLMDEESIEW